MLAAGVVVDWGPRNDKAEARELLKRTREKLQPACLFADAGYWDPNGTVEDANDDFWVEGDYHLQSQGGRWDAGIESWVLDEASSPGIDTGDPLSAIGAEAFANGGRINIGAYGGTRQASKSYFGSPPCEVIVAGDINGDCKVNFKDIGFMTLHWLRQEKP